MRLYLTSAIIFLGGLSLFLWALFAWESTSFVMGPERTTDGRIGGLFILLLGIGLGFMVAGLFLFIHRDKPAQAPDSESELSDSPYKPFEKLWQYANIGYVLGAFIVFFVYPFVGVDLRGWRHVEFFLAIAIALPFISFALLGIYTGRISEEEKEYSRSKNPFMHWLLVAFSLFVGIAAILVGIGGIGK